MKRLILVLSLFSVTGNAQQFVQGYVNSRGTYVQPYVRSQPNGYTQDNINYQEKLREQDQQQRVNNLINGYHSGSGGLYNY